MRGIPTTFDGVNFRSRLEAKWACFFTLAEWEWQYEPCDFRRWIPDFALYGKQRVYVEVKPVVAFPEDVAKEIDASGCTDEVLIVGERGPFGVRDTVFPEASAIGWLRQAGACDNDREWCWSECVVVSFRDYASGVPVIGFCHETGGWGDRMTGDHDGNWGACGDAAEQARKLWKQAGNITQWRPRVTT